MPTENTPELAAAVREFISAEALRRGIAPEECLRAVAAVIKSEAGAVSSDDDAWSKSPPIPPGGCDDPNYKPALHGWRDDDHLDELIQEGLDSGPGRTLTPKVWDEIRAKARARAGLD